MAKTIWARSAALAIAASSLAVTGALLACSESTDEELSRGVTTYDAPTGAMPFDDEEKLTEEQRRAREAAAEEALERREFNDSGQGDNAPTAP